MIAGGDYYTKIESVETSSGELDTFNISREKITINLDDNKTGNYNLLVDDFQNNGTGTVYFQNIEAITNLNEYDINWEKVKTNEKGAVIHKLDTYNDGITDKETELKPIHNNENTSDEIAPKTKLKITGVKKHKQDKYKYTIKKPKKDEKIKLDKIGKYNKKKLDF